MNETNIFFSQKNKIITILLRLFKTKSIGVYFAYRDALLQLWNERPWAYLSESNLRSYLYFVQNKFQYLPDNIRALLDDKIRNIITNKNKNKVELFEIFKVCLEEHNIQIVFTTRQIINITRTIPSTWQSQIISMVNLPYKTHKKLAEEWHKKLLIYYYCN